MTNGNYHHSAVVNYCAIRECIRAPITEELQAVCPHLRAVGMHQEHINVACSVPLPNMCQAALGIRWDTEFHVRSICVGVRVRVVGVVGQIVRVAPIQVWVLRYIVGVYDNVFACVVVLGAVGS